MAVEQTITYVGELHCELIHGPSGASVETDAPVDNAGRGQSFSPTDLVASALASCALTTIAIKAARHGIHFESGRARIVKEMTSSPPRSIAALHLDVRLPGHFPDEERRQLEDFARTCPVALSLGDSVNVVMVFTYGDV
ncbi:MAG: OsmC family protein [Myxococcota bacterium]